MTYPISGRRILLFGLILIILSSFASAIIVPNDPSTILYHSFDDDEYAAPTYSDLTPSGYDATNFGSTTGGAGIYKESVSTDGLNDYLTTNGAIAELLTNNEGTVCGWVNSAVGGWGITFSNFGSGSHLGLLITATSLQFEGNAGCLAGGNQRLLGDTDITDSTWHHWCFASDGSTVSLVTDGSNNTITENLGTNRGDWFGDMSCGPNRMAFGSLQRGAPLYSAIKFDEVVIFNRSLSLTEMQQLYAGGAPGENEQYPFGVPEFELTLINSYNSSVITNFTAQIDNTTTIVNITTNNGSVFWPLDQIINISIFNITGAEGFYFNTSYTNYNSSVNLQAEAYQSILNVFTVNLDNSTEFVDITYTLNNTGEVNSNSSEFSTISPTRFNITSGSYTILAEKAGFPNANGTFSIVPLENKSVYLTMGIIATLNLIDEATLEPFNLTNTNSTRVTVVCADIGSQEITLYPNAFNTSTQNITIACEYTKLRFTIQYDDTGYTRTLLSSEVDIFEQDVYLIDLITTQSIFNSFIVNDYVGEYEDIKLFVKKNVEGAQVIIHSDDIDVENKMSVFLIENDEYILELVSSNNPTLALGFYGADLSGGKEITVTTANADLNAPDILGNGLTILTFSSGNGTLLAANAAYTDDNGNTDSIVWTLAFFNTTNSSYQQFYTVTSLSNDVIFVPQNISIYENTSVLSVMQYTIDGVTETFSKIIHVAVVPISTGTMFFWFTAAAIQWGIIILLSIVTLTGTIVTQNYVNYILLGIAALAVVFSLLEISIVVLVLSLFVNFMDQIRKGEAKNITQQ